MILLENLKNILKNIKSKQRQQRIYKGVSFIKRTKSYGAELRAYIRTKHIMDFRYKINLRGLRAAILVNYN